MISVQNRLQQLNGNKFKAIKFLVFLFALSFSVSSCHLFKKVPKEDTSKNQNDKDNDELDEIEGPVVYNPETGEYEPESKRTPKVDTVKWKVEPIENYPPITSDDDPISDGNNNTDGNNGQTDVSQKLRSYNVALLLPFLADKSTDDHLDPKSSLALNFYGGAKMAFDRLSSEQINLSVSVLDTKATSQGVEQLLQTSELYNAHLIIGPVRKRGLKLVADFAKENKKVLVSPISASSSIAKENPYFVQVSPSLKIHCEAITKHVKEQYSTDQIVLVCRKKREEIARLEHFQNANIEIQGDSRTPKFRELIIEDETSNLEDVDLSEIIKEGQTTVFILPSWSNESFIYNFMRKVKLDKKANKVVVYGMPQWMKYTRISYDYYEELNVHVSSDVFIDPDSPKTKAFRQDYFDRYGTVPTYQAFVGYDTMLYFGRMIHKKGTNFQHTLDQEHDEYLHTNFNFEGVAAANSSIENYIIKQYENKYVHILEFEDYYFQLAN